MKRKFKYIAYSLTSILLLAVLIGCNQGQDEVLNGNQETKTFPPAGRSISFSDPAREQEFINRLTEADIGTYRMSALENNWVVWEFKDTEAVIGLWDFRPEQIEMFRALKSELGQENASNQSLKSGTPQSGAP